MATRKTNSVDYYTHVVREKVIEIDATQLVQFEDRDNVDTLVITVNSPGYNNRMRRKTIRIPIDQSAWEGMWPR